MMLGLLGVIVPLVLLGLVVTGIVVLVRRRHGARAGSSAPVSAGTSVRRFFQYLLLTALLIAAASGLTGLLGRLGSGDDTLVRDDTLLALQLTFVLIALPVWGGLAWWTSRRLAADPGEAHSIGWSFSLVVIGLVSLVVAMIGWYAALSQLVGPEAFRASSLAQAVVWTAVYLGHRWWGERPVRAPALRVLDLLGSLAGLVTAATGLGQLVAASLRALTTAGDSLVDTGTGDLVRAGSLLLVGAVVWVGHWLLRTARSRKDTPWLALVLLGGVGGGLVTAIFGASVALYTVLVWLVGDPGGASASRHFGALPSQLGVIVAALLVWWYHQEILDVGGGRERARTEVRRVYEYLLAAIGLVAAAAGLTMVIVTLVEAVAGNADLLVSGSVINTLLATLVLLAVGLPLWWRHWSQAQRARAQDAAAEVASTTRRSYLLVLFGVAGVTAVVALIIAVFLVLEDVLGADLGVETLRRVRFALGILVTATLLSAYHWRIFRGDREESAVEAAADSPAAAPRVRHILLIGGPDDGVSAEVARHTGATAQVVVRTDAETPAWDLDVLRSALAVDTDDDVVVLSEPDGLRVIPVRR